MKKENTAINNILELIGNPGSGIIYIFTSKGKYNFARQLHDDIKAHGFQGRLFLLDTILNETNLNRFKEQLIGISDDYGIIFLIESNCRKNYFDIFGRPDSGLILKPEHFFSDLFLPLDSLIRIYGIDLKELDAFKRTLLSELEGASLIDISTDSGTEISIKPRSWNSTEIGEIFTAPVEYIAEGRIVVDGCVYSGPPEEKFTLEIKGGRVININSLNANDEQQKMLMKDLTGDENTSILAEFGIGINPGALWYKELMEAECARGTCHFGFGNNMEYGGNNKSSYHLDVVVKDPTIIIDGKKICNAGTYLLG